MRTKKRSPLPTPAMVLELAGHTGMGVALGLALAFILTRIPTVGVMTLINHSASPRAAMLMFIGTFATMFGIGTTLTGLVFIVTKDS
jgi:hypothetical protein